MKIRKQNSSHLEVRNDDEKLGEHPIAPMSLMKLPNYRENDENVPVEAQQSGLNLEFGRMSASHRIPDDRVENPSENQLAEGEDEHLETRLDETLVEFPFQVENALRSLLQGSMIAGFRISMRNIAVRGISMTFDPFIVGARKQEDKNQSETRIELSVEQEVAICRGIL